MKGILTRLEDWLPGKHQGHPTGRKQRTLWWLKGGQRYRRWKSLAHRTPQPKPTQRPHPSPSHPRKGKRIRLQQQRAETGKGKGLGETGKQGNHVWTDH
jgi:hypothetical protein